jgi:peptide/nickel transport system permease protein
LGGTVIVETIYALPGMGQLLVTAVGDNDYPIVQGVVLIVAVSYVMLNLIVDVSYGFLDPRTRRGRR